ncbi:MAG: isoaspartyl peptidase/L-asparaginase family protein [Candidatus Kapaibacterium sp.]
MYKYILIFAFVLTALAACNDNNSKEKLSNAVENSGEYVLVIHGGAGFDLPEDIPEDRQREYRIKMTEALRVGEAILKNGGSAVDAVEEAIQMLEDSPLFNAGKGSVFNAEGRIEMDASIMSGHGPGAGAVANVRYIKNPISAAREVMDKTEHILLISDGAEEFAKSHGLEFADSAYFFTETRWQSYLKSKEKADSSGKDKMGTVGAVALDKQGNLAAGTSTGGMTYKKFGRVGDSPIIGAGTFAHNETCAVSATGHGEYFIINAVAYDVSARMKYLDESLVEASGYIIDQINEQGGYGGLICVDKYGNISWPFSSNMMFRAMIKEGSDPLVKIFRDED